METYGFVGPSGTGKSYRAQTLAFEKGIDTVIDDGLLIHNKKRVCGTSAKAEATVVAAVKKAIFSDIKDREKIIKKIEEIKPGSILLLGTSDKMVQIIARNLKLPKISEDHFISIEDVASSEEISIAQKMRNEYGMHVIPIPEIEIKSDFKGYLMKPIKYLMRFLPMGHEEIYDSQGKYKVVEGENTIIKPVYSKDTGKEITKQTIEAIVRSVVYVIPEVKEITKLEAKVDFCNVELNLGLGLYMDRPINLTVREIIITLRSEINRFSGANVEKVYLNIEKVYYRD